MNFDVSDMWETLTDWLFNLVMTIIAFIMDMITYVLNLIPVPDFINALPAYVSGIPSSVLFFASALELPTGLALIGTALIARSLLAIIPFLGAAFR